MLVLTTLCVISVIGWPITWTASADSSLATLHRSSSRPYDTPVVDGPIGTSGLPADGQFPYVTDCTDEFQSYGNYDDKGNPTTYNQVCWSKGDFQWGNADITCIVNASLKAQFDNFNKDKGLNFGQNPIASTTPGANAALGGHNQNTCVDGHT